MDGHPYAATNTNKYTPFSIGQKQIHYIGHMGSLDG
jgi:hypothetical protein